VNASRDHARLEWNGERWTVRDLGSTNGTLLNGRRLAAGVDHLLAKGDVLAFGSEEHTFHLVDDSPPVPAAIPADGRPPVFGASDVLVLPDARAPELVVHRQSAELWIVSRGAASEALVPDARVTAGGTEWRLVLPAVLPPTVGVVQTNPGLGWTLRLRVDADGEHVAVEIVRPTDTVTLPSRAHQRLLVPLVRERQRAARRGIAPDDAGWVAPEDLMAHLDLVHSTFFVQLFRLRNQLSGTGAAEGVPVLERRFTGEIRVGTERVELVEVD
jgi:hypothetical protein